MHLRSLPDPILARQVLLDENHTWCGQCHDLLTAYEPLLPPGTALLLFDIIPAFGRKKRLGASLIAAVSGTSGHGVTVMQLLYKKYCKTMVPYKAIIKIAYYPMGRLRCVEQRKSSTRSGK